MRLLIQKCHALPGINRSTGAPKWDENFEKFSGLQCSISNGSGKQGFSLLTGNNWGILLGFTTSFRAQVGLEAAFWSVSTTKHPPAAENSKYLEWCGRQKFRTVEKWAIEDAYVCTSGE